MNGEGSMTETVKTFAAQTWEGNHLLQHVALPYHQPQPPAGTYAWGATRCGRAVRLNGSGADELCEECWAK